MCHLTHGCHDRVFLFFGALPGLRRFEHGSVRGRETPPRLGWVWLWGGHGQQAAEPGLGRSETTGIDGGIELDTFRKHHEGLVLERLAKDEAAREP